MSIKRVSAETYIVLVPEVYGTGSYRYVRSLRVNRVRSGKPTVGPSEIAVRIKLNFDERSILDAIPLVEVDVERFAAGGPASGAEIEVTEP